MRTTKWILKSYTLLIQPQEIIIIIEDIGNRKLTKGYICLMKKKQLFWFVSNKNVRQILLGNFLWKFRV